MPTIGKAVLDIFASMDKVPGQIAEGVKNLQIEVKVSPSVDKPAVESIGKQVKESVEKTDIKVKPQVDKPAVQQAAKEVKETVEKAAPAVKPKVDQKAAQDAGAKTGEAVAQGVSGSSSAVGQAIIGALQGSLGEGGRLLGQKLAEQIPAGLTGSAERIATALRNSLPAAGEAGGIALGTAIGIKLTDAIGKEKLDRAGVLVMTNLRKAIGAANTATTIGVSIGNSIATGLTSASGVVAGAAGSITNTIGGITVGVEGAKQLLGEDSWAAPGLDSLNDGLTKATPLLNAVTGAATVASAGAQAISIATGLASKAQLIWNAALIANPIGLIVAAIAAVVAGLVLFFTKTELGQRIWQGFTEYLSIAWEAIKTAFSAAWDVISAIFTSMVEGAKAVWDGIKGAFTGVVDFVAGLPAAIGRAASGMWEGLKSGLVAVLNWVGDKWNAFADSLSIDLPGTAFDVSLPKIARFAGGGYTGDGSKDQPAGIVHAGEFVIKSDSTAKIQNAMPGLLDYLNGKGALPGYAGGGLVAGSEQLRKIIGDKFGISNIGGYRPADKYGEHSTGRALDVMTSSKSTGDAIKDFAVQNASAIDLKWAIWDQKIWSPDGSSKVMPDRGDPTQNHMDHVHIFSGEGISQGLRGSLADQSAKDGSAASGVMPGGDVSAPDQTGAAASGSGQQSMSVPGSLSGAAGMFGDQLGAGVGATQSGSDLSLIGNAAGTAVTGQVSSALGSFGVGDSPGWLNGISTFASGISVGGGGGGASPMPDVTPVSASAPVSAASSAVGGALSGVHGATPGAAPGPVTNYNMYTTDIEPAYLAAQRNDKERAAANLGRY